MRYVILFALLSLLLLSGCQRYSQPDAYPVPAQPEYTTISSTSITTSATTTIFDCKSCPAGYICRNEECIKVEYSSTGGGSSGGGGGY